MATAETSSMAAVSKPLDVAPEQPPPDVERPKVSAARPSRRRRRTSEVSEGPDIAGAEHILSHDELAQLGSLMVRARANGQDLEAYVADLRSELMAWDRLAVIEGPDDAG